MAEQDDPNDTSLSEDELPPRMLVPAPPVPLGRVKRPGVGS